MKRERIETLALLVAALALGSCAEEQGYAKAYKMETMAQAIGGPAAAARPGDLMLENDKLRAVIHARRHKRSTFPIGNGNLVDLDIQRPHHRFGVGKGKDVFYEIGPMVNLKVSSAKEITHGLCGAVGPSACPQRPCEEGGQCQSGAKSGPDPRCARISVTGKGDNILGILGLLDFAIRKPYPTGELQIVTDYDVCPGESFVRMTTRARFYGATGELIDMQDLPGKTSLFDALLGQHSGIDCARQACPPEAPTCSDLLEPLSLGSLSTEMKRCRRPTDKLGGVLGGDFTFFSAKAGIFIPGSGYDHETFIRSIFDTGGDIFSNPLALDYIAAVSDDVSYAYFNAGGQVMIPLFSESFTVSMTNSFGCTPGDPECFKGKELVFRRFVAVGDGSVASALAPFYKIRGIPTATVTGHVISERSRRPVSGVQVFALRLPQAWQSMSDAQVAQKSYAELVAAARAETRSADNPLGEVGMLSHFVTDTGLDTVPDGSFSGVLPVLDATKGRLVLVTRDSGSNASALVPLTLKAGGSASATLIRPSRATLAYEIRDVGGRAIPSKITVGACMPDCGSDADCILNGRAESGFSSCDAKRRICVAPQAAEAKDCRPDQRWDGKGCSCPLTARLPLELGGKRRSDGNVRTDLSLDGRGSLHLPPGTYEVIASRGIEYEIDRKFVTLQAGVTKRFTAALPRVVDTKGWVAADFHIHGPNSVDSGLDHVTRVTSYVAEGVEFMSSSDHDYLTNYQPTILRLGVSPWITSQIGVECSPLDYGHFLGFPLRFDERLELNGAFHWRAGKSFGDPDWKNLVPAEVFNGLRERGELGDDTMVVIAHFYDHFTFYDLHPVTLEPPGFSVTAVFNDVLSAGNFSGAFDGLEALSGKNMDIIRRPTYAEIREYNVGLTALLKRTDLSYDELQDEWARLSAGAQRSFLHRTKEEQAKGLSYDNATFECRCTADEDCGAKSLCNEKTGACIPGCEAKADCDAILAAADREDCLPKNAGDSSRKTCQRVDKTCATDAECTLTWGTDTKEKCLDAPGGGKRCEIPCERDSNCSDVDKIRSVCDTARKVCVLPTIEAATDIDPCVTLRGTIDDWFQMLNRGVRRSVFGNSDSHDTYNIEGGIPRTYVRSPTDQPAAIDKRELATALKKLRSFATFGPFVEVQIDGKGSGATVQPKDSKIKLALRVQSPRWFDVDRLEIYRNGELIRVIAGKKDCAEGAKDCLRVPNTKVINFDAVIEDTPTEDSWYVVIAMGLDGKSLAPIYSSTPVARLGIFELVQRLTPLLPPLRSLRTPLSPSITRVRPYAVTNPIFVDLDGDGIIKAKHPLPTWATDADRAAQQGAKSSALTGKSAAAAAPAGSSSSDKRLASPSHDHRMGLGRLRREARVFMDALKSGKVSRKDLQRVLGSLRGIGHVR
jgi:hypothetical protein